jgi:hypothetical protein
MAGRTLIITPAGCFHQICRFHQMMKPVSRGGRVTKVGIDGILADRKARRDRDVDGGECRLCLRE